MWRVVFLSISALVFSYKLKLVLVILFFIGGFFFISLKDSFSSSLRFSETKILDTVSSLLIFLTIVISVGMVFRITIFKNLSLYILQITLSLKVLVWCFLRKGFIKFFIFFELRIIPTLFLILGWGVQPERLLAGSYMILYTLFGSLPLLLNCILLTLIKKRDSFFFSNLVLENRKFSFFLEYRFSRGLILLFWRLAFLIKLPIFRLHLWLPKAHVEAPAVGSMILAGVLLKLGAYGLLRASLLVDLKKWEYYKLFFLF